MKDRILDVILALSAGATAFFIGVGTLLPSADFSEEENRMLATLSVPALSEIADGSFFTSVSEYYRDRIPFRKFFTSAKTYAELTVGKGENNGVLFCKDGYLLDRGEYERLDIAKENIGYFSSLADAFEAAGTETAVTYAPRGIDVMKDKLPVLYRGSEEEVWALMTHSEHRVTELTSSLRDAAKRGEYVWYRTDHHWTARGAYIAYRALSEEMGFTPYGEECFDRVTVSSEFLGSIYSRAGCVAPLADSVELYRYAEDDGYTLRIDGGEREYGLYFTEKLDAKDKYAVFLGGNYAIATVEKKGVRRERLLILKDSYANSLVPFLALHYDLELIDLRYFEGGREELIQKAASADKALIIHGIDTAATYSFASSCE